MVTLKNSSQKEFVTSCIEECRAGFPVMSTPFTSQYFNAIYTSKAHRMEAMKELEGEGFLTFHKKVVKIKKKHEEESISSLVLSV